jgi:TonB family protein
MKKGVWVRAVGILVAVLGTTHAPVAFGQTAPPAIPDLVPPEILSKAEPIYPEGETKNANVIVEVVVGIDGAVEDVKVVEGEPPFAEAALTAARKYRFKPATRAGRPVRARIRVAVEFTVTVETRRPAPAPELAPAAPPSTPIAKPIQITKPAPIEEVKILGRRDVQSPTEHRMKRAEMRVIPGAFGDPFRAIDVLPSLVPIISGLPYFYIRGAPPSAVGYYVDEVRVPYLFHFALGPGVVQPALIEEVALHPAAYPARFGRYAGGIVAGTTRDPATELHGEAQIRLIDAGAYVETPLANGRASVGIGGRYSYTAAVISLFAPEVTIDYRDYNARASYQLTDNLRVSALAIGSYDYASNTKDGIEEVLFASEFHRLDLRLDHQGTNGSRSRVATTVGIDRTRLEGSRFAQDWLTGVRGRHTWSAGQNVDMEIGADALAEFYVGDLPSRFAVRPEDYRTAETLFSPRTDTATGLWTAAIYRPAPGWDLTGILRADAFTSDGKVAIGPSPRISAKVPIIPKVSFLAAMGVANQPPAFAIPVPAVGFRGLPGGLSYAYQKSAGLEIGLPLRFTLKTVGFHHSYFNLRDFARNRDNIDLDKPQPDPGSPSQGYGLEVFLSRKMSERYAAFTSFTLQRSQLGSTLREPAAVSPFDRSYVFQVGGVVDLGRGWKTSARFLTYGGWPLERDPTTGRVVGRLPGFMRLDARLEKRWTMAKERWISLVFEGLNVTGSTDIVGRNCSPEGCRNQELGPIIVPSIGVEGGL